MSATFQKTVQRFQGSGVTGSRRKAGDPFRAEPYLLNSTASGEPNIIGFAYTILPGTSGDLNVDNTQVTVGGTGVFAGILINPNVYPSQGSSLGVLEPTLEVANGITGQFSTMGEFFVGIGNAGTQGEGVHYNDTTGSLGAGDAGVGETQIVGAEINLTTTSPGITWIKLTG
jgi:hypothetical protein